jgi:glycosyltransferase involved in cell wall biosynthesis
MQFARQWKDVTIFIPINKDAEIPEDCQLPNVVYIRLEHWYPFGAAQAQISSELYSLFNPVNGKYQVDAIVTSKNLIGANLKRLFYNSPTLNIPVIIAEYWVQEPENLPNSVEVKLRAVSWSECRTIFHTHREKRFAITEGRRFLSAASTAEIIDRGIVRSQGLPCKFVQTIAQKTEKFDKFTLLFAARFNSNKRWKEVLSAYEDIFRMGLDVQIKAIKPNSVGLDDLKLFEKVEYFDPLGYEDYITLMSKCHVSVSMSRDEGFSMGLSEQRCTGNPVLLPDKDWAKELVPRDYPYIYKSPTEMLAMLRYCYANYAEARSKIATTVEEFIAEHDIEVAAAGYLQIVTAEVAGTWMPFREWDPKFRDTLTVLPEQFTLDEFAKAAGKRHKAQFGNYVVIIGAHRNLHRWLVANTDVVLGETNLYKQRS